MKQLMKYYEEKEAICRAYDIADAVKDEAGREAARADINAWDAKIMAKGKHFARVYRLYEAAMERCNEMIDINEVVWDKDFDDLMDEFHRNGITRFTYSSTWSGAVETAWKFREAGWKLTGMTQINGCCRAFMSDEYEKVPAYVFEY